MAKFTLKTPQGKSYKLNDADEIHRGGEGRILAIASDAGLVAKIYHHNITPLTTEQFNYLTQLNSTLFVVPQELLLDKKQQICGFTMEYIGRDFFPLAAIFSKNFCARNGISQIVKRKIGEGLINALHYAHQSKLVIGDFNQYNVLINKKGAVKLIDTDSYQTPNHKHSGILLDDIRDYLYGGQVTQNSDFFALSVLLFYSFTHTHPFKGIHKTIKMLSERMIKKIPVFANDSDLRVPKCYVPIADKNLQTQFNELYLHGKRFAISLDATGAIARKTKPVKITKIVQDQLIIRPIVQDTDVRSIFFMPETGYIETEDNYLVYSTANKGYTTLRSTISKQNGMQIFTGSQNIFIQQGKYLYKYQSDAEKIQITNFVFPDDSITYQLENILIVIGADTMYWVYLDEVVNQSVRNIRTQVFGRGFIHYVGLYQNAGGIPRIFYNTGHNIATVKFPVTPKEIYQQRNIGIVQYTDKKQVKTRYFFIDGLQTQIVDEELDYFYDFAFMPNDSKHGFVFQPSDNHIKIRRTEDFQQISSLDCNLISGQSKLQHTKAGIIAWENDAVYLLNKK